MKGDNLVNIIRQAAILNILGIGMTVVILSGGIDLSNGAVLALSSCVSAIYLKDGGPIGIGIVIALSIGLVCGLINGWMVAKISIPPFIITYAMMFFARGLAYIVLDGKIIYGFTLTLQVLRRRSFGGFNPYPIERRLSSFSSTLLRYTFGVDIYALGSDEESSRLSGVKTRYRIISVYALSGLRLQSQESFICHASTRLNR
jgi:ribose transport system permease protein